jgi:ribosomal protein S18 acetylase RimI-like enzyme
MPPTIRNTFEDGELPALYKIERECFDPEFRWSEPMFVKALQAAREQSHVWIAMVSGRIAGYLLAGDENGKVLIETANVARAHRRKGIATKLIAACERDMRKRGYTEVKLEVWTENPAMILYFNLGYRVCGFKKDYYRPHTHAVSMIKKL